MVTARRNGSRSRSWSTRSLLIGHRCWFYIRHCDTAGLFFSESWLDGVLPWGPPPPTPRSTFHEFGPVIGESAWPKPPWLSWSIELAASYCVFSNRVIRRSSSSPNSPPISDGSPTTITSCKKKHNGLDLLSSSEERPPKQKKKSV